MSNEGEKSQKPVAQSLSTAQVDAEAKATVDAPAAEKIVDPEWDAKMRQLFNGIAVVIDDEVDKAGASITTIIGQIRAAGGHVVTLNELPDDDADLSQFAGASFFIMDWQLEPTLTADDDGVLQGANIGATLEEENNKRKLSFLKRLSQSRLAPVFIFTAGKKFQVIKVLKRDSTLYVEDRANHIFVEFKDDVVGRGVFAVLSEWVQRTPSALVLKAWERDYEQAKNATFLELYTKTVDWPVMLWKTFKDDGLAASDELGRLITRIIFSRMTPFDLDLNSLLPLLGQDGDAEAYRRKLLDVLESERFVSETALHANSVAPGDVFKAAGSDDYYINIRPDCDCVARDGQPLELYLLKGSRQSNPAKMIDREHGTLQEGEGQAAVFCMYQGKTITFNLKDIHLRRWEDVKAERIGRLLPPFLTRLQQRYASYLQRPGLPRIPKEAIPPEPAAKAASTTA
ncbi:MAG: hypothetical protein M3N82_01525 [Pseudomonadota bacterium]|nr:hypothetical protein [Pseudomonadota bacterium]